MHPRNPYKQRAPDFNALARKYADFRLHCFVDTNGKLRVNFRDSDAVRSLTKTLLHNDFGLDVVLPPDCLVPRVPQRLNYILCIEDILENCCLTGNVLGIDIGTGASCIYALLGAKHCGWKFIGTEVDEFAAEVAIENVRRNNLEDQIEVLQVFDDQLIKDIVRSRDENKVTFCMCNPPFYEYDEFEEKYECLSDQVVVNSCSTSISGRSAPHSATVAKCNELAVQGGEVAFVGRLIEESFVLRDSVKLYTSMVGKKSSLVKLKRKLHRCLNVQTAVINLCQGKTQRWVLAWTFDSKMNLPMSTKKISPLELRLPQAFFTRRNALDWIRKTLASLEITCESVEPNVLVCEAIRNNWSQQRQRDRIAGRSSGPPKTKLFRPAAISISCLVNLGCGDGRDSYTNEGNFSSCTHIDSKIAKKRDAAVQVYMPLTGDVRPLVRFRIEAYQTESLIKFYFADGSRSAVHQIWQFCKNQLAKAESTLKASQV